MKKLKDVFDLLDSLEEKNEKIGILFGETEFFDDEISFIWDLIGKQYKIEIDNWEAQDKVADLLMNFVGGVSKKETIKKLEKLSKNQNEKTKVRKM